MSNLQRGVVAIPYDFFNCRTARMPSAATMDCLEIPAESERLRQAQLSVVTHDNAGREVHPIRILTIISERIEMSKAMCMVLAAVLSATAYAGDKSLEGIACRSVHLSYQNVPDAAVFCNEVKIEQSAPGTYFCVCGFSQGYYGIQELADGKKLILFSVWDPGDQNNPEDVKEEQRVKLLHHHADVRVGRFGNEGTGGQSFVDFEWQIGETYRFAVAARRTERRTEFAAFFFYPDEKTWRHLVTFSTLTEDTAIKGTYAFVEDFRRNRVSTKLTRQAMFPNGRVMTADGKWHIVNSATFTGDGNPVVNIDSGLRDNQFWIATGGSISNAHNPLNGVMKRTTDVAVADAPDDLNTIVTQWLNSGNAR